MPVIRRFPNLPPSLRFLLILFFALGSSSLANAQDWSYRVRPGDTLWDLGARHLRSDRPWQQLQAHNSIADPYHLRPGQTLRFPIAWLRLRPAPARLLALRGTVTLRDKEGAAARQMVNGQDLGIGNELATGPDSSATLEFADGSRLQLRENSVIRLDRLSEYGHTGMVDTRVRLQQGRTQHQVTPAKGPASRYIIQSPAATSSVRGTRFRVSAGDAGKDAATEVLEGKVLVSSSLDEGLFLPGQAALQHEGARLVSTALPPAPVLEVLQHPLGPFPVRVSWKPVAGAAAYRVEVVDALIPEILVFARNTDRVETDVDSLPPGEYRLLVRAVTVEGVEGEDAHAPVTVADAPAPPLTIRPAQGETLSSARPRFEWTRNPQAAATILQIARDASFREVLAEQSTNGTRLRPDQPLANGDYFWRVASRGMQGQQSAFSQPRSMTVTDEPVVTGMQAPVARRGQLTIRWQQSESAQRYRVQISRDPAFSRLLLDREVEAPEVTLDRPSAGTWRIRFQRIEDDGYAGPFSAPQELKLPCRLCYVGGGALLLLLAL